jgi:hypothetical protein
MNSPSSLAGCHSPCCSDSFCGLRRLQRDSLPCSKLAGSDLTSSVSKFHRHGRPRHFQSYRNEVGCFVQASVRGMNYQRHDRRVIEHWSQLGGGCCVKSKYTRKLRHVGVSRVGSVLRNLEQEDDTARERRYTHSFPCEDSRVHGEAVAREQPSNVPRAVAPSNPPPNPHRNEHDVEHPGAKNGADKKGEGLDVQETSIDGPGDGKQSLVSLLDAGDTGWRDAVVQGFGHSHGTVQVQPEAGKKGEDPSEVSIYIS